MPDAQLVFLSPAWRDLDRISDLHMLLAETKSAEEITDKLLDTIALLAGQPYLGALHPEPFMAWKIPATGRSPEFMRKMDSAGDRWTWTKTVSAWKA